MMGLALDPLFLPSYQNIIKKIVCSLGFFFFIGCTTTGPKFQKADASKSDNSIVYIYRGYISCGALDGVYVQVDGHGLGKLYNNGYVAVEVGKGDHLITISENNYSIDQMKDGVFIGVKRISAEGNKPYFVKYNVECNGIIGNHRPNNDLKLIPSKRALLEIKDLNMAADKVLKL